MWVWDVSADDLWMTEQGRAMFGFTPDTRIDYAATFDRVHPEDYAMRERAIRRALETRGEYDMEYRVLEPDGKVRWINARARCMKPGGGGGGGGGDGSGGGTGLKLFGVSMDVTARKAAEASAAQERDELQQKRVQLEHLARVATLGELTATLTHELRQPLAAILFQSAIAARLLDRSEPDLQGLRGALADIDDITRRAAEVVAGLRDMLKRDTRGPTRVDLNHLIRTVDRIVHGDAMHHGVTVHLDLSSDAGAGADADADADAGSGAGGGPAVTGDNVQLQQVMLNLMLNAFSAMRERERDARRLVVRMRSTADGTILVDVQDNGSGIPPDKLESIFEPFVTSKPDGLGMGLSICRSIIERHGGTLRAANNPDGGATFSITLPAAAAASRAGEAAVLEA
jgi:C4-dicarboxylate-specific signal transduction histidine kinase